MVQLVIFVLTDWKYSGHETSESAFPLPLLLAIVDVRVFLTGFCSASEFPTVVDVVNVQSFALRFEVRAG